MPDGGSPPENQALPVTAPTQTSEEQPGKKAMQAATEPAHTGPAGHRSVSTVFPVQSEVSPELSREGAEKQCEGSRFVTQFARVWVPVLSDFGHITTSLQFSLQ